MAAVEHGRIHFDRYESYLRILQELRETRKAAHG
jgi:putative ribosome biogenesis GTPase RsgA